jgi:hypothetical protein
MINRQKRHRDKMHKNGGVDVMTLLNSLICQLERYTLTKLHYARFTF